MSDTADPSVQRKNSFSYDELIDCAQGRLFGPGNAQLPMPPMLMVDRVTEISETGGSLGRGAVTAEYDITPERWFYKCHFEGDPVMPGCLGLDGLWQMTGFFLGWLGLPGRGRALGVGEVRLTNQILPTAKKLVYKLDVKRVVRGKLVLGITDGAITVDGEPAYEAKSLRVGLFQTEAG
ncbi:MAG: 3-hydroxyacyl-[acyl-carrier-protein] dehydratase FabA [Pseudomonadota bacterium]